MRNAGDGDVEAGDGLVASLRVLVCRDAPVFDFLVSGVVLVELDRVTRAREVSK